MFYEDKIVYFNQISIHLDVVAKISHKINILKITLYFKMKLKI